MQPFMAAIHMIHEQQVISAPRYTGASLVNSLQGWLCRQMHTVMTYVLFCSCTQDLKEHTITGTTCTCSETGLGGPFLMCMPVKRSGNFAAPDHLTTIPHWHPSYIYRPVPSQIPAKVKPACFYLMCLYAAHPQKFRQMYISWHWVYVQYNGKYILLMLWYYVEVLWLLFSQTVPNQTFILIV